MKALLRKLAKPVVQGAAARFGPHARPAGGPRLWVLMYHRVLPRTDVRYALEEPGMKVTPETLAMHLGELHRHFEVVSLRQWLADYRAGRPLPRKACAVTFDDGWQDNFEYALPLLQQYRVPATLFAVADKIGTDFQFWPNIVAALMRQGLGPELARHRPFDCPEVEVSPADTEAVARAVAALKRHSDDELLGALEALDWQSWLHEPLAPALMSWEQLKIMQASGLVDIGSHTCTHRRLTDALDESVLDEEIRQSRERLEQKLGESVPLFCFPNGDYGQESLALVERHYEAAVTTRRGINRVKALTPHQLLRVGLHEDSADTPTKFRSRLACWL